MKNANESIPEKRIESLLVVVVAAILAIISIVLVLRAKTNTQDWENWVEIQSDERLEFEKFKSMFGSNDYVVASWAGCTIDDPRLQAFSDSLLKVDKLGLIKNAVNGKQIVARMTEHPNRLTEAQAKRRLQNIFFGSDSELTCTAIELSRLGSSNRKESIQMIESVADSINGLGAKNLKLGGHAFVSVELDRQTNRSMNWALPACLTAVLIGWLAIGNVRMTIVALSVAGLAALFSMSLVVISGNDINGLLVLMPVLVLTVTLSSAVHLLGYYRSAVQSSHPQPESEMIRLGWRPAVFAMLTSAIGVGSLFVGKVPAVSQFGIFSACSILIGLILLCLLFPNALRLFAKTTTLKTSRLAVESIGPLRKCFLKIATSHPALVTVGFVAVLVVSGFGLGLLTTNLESSGLFSKDSKFAQDNRWFEENVISLETVELVISFGTSSQYAIDEQLRSLASIQNALVKDDRIKSTFSIVNFIKSFPSTSKDVQSITERTTFNETLEGRRNEFVENGLLASIADTSVWRVTICCDSSQNIDFDNLIASCKSSVENAKRPIETEPDFVFTGMAPIAWRGHQQLFRDLASSFLLALCVITPMMIVLLRTIIGGLIAMLPNVFPPIVLFGILGWARYSVDVGMILTASVGLGIAVDNTFHFLHRFRVVMDEGNSVRDAVKNAFIHCSTPMLQTTAICSFGLAFFTFADFIPVRQFSLAIVAILILAVLADLFLLPALAGIQKGRFFVKQSSRK